MAAASMASTAWRSSQSGRAVGTSVRMMSVIGGVVPRLAGHLAQLLDAHRADVVGAVDHRHRLLTRADDVVPEELLGRGLGRDGEHVGVQRRGDRHREPAFEVAEARADLGLRHRPPTHHQLGGHGGDEPGHDEAGSSRGLGDEHHGGERDAVAGTEEGGDADEREQRRVGVAEEPADGTAQQRALDDERDEQPADAPSAER